MTAKRNSTAGILPVAGGEGTAGRIPAVLPSCASPRRMNQRAI